MKKLLFLLPFILLSCQKDNVEPTNSTPPVVEIPENTSRTVIVSNGLIMPDAFVTQDHLGRTSINGNRGDLIWIRVDGCGIPMFDLNGNMTISGPTTCTANLTVVGVGNYSILRYAHWPAGEGQNRSFVIP